MASLAEKKKQLDNIINKTVIICSVGIFLIIFFAFTINSLYSKYTYQSKVISLQSKALVNLNKDLAASKGLDKSFISFIQTNPNIINGNSTNPNSVNGGDNSKIILDALPSSYDFPELVTSLQNLLNSQSVSINSISGIDQSSTVNVSSGSGVTTIPFQISVTGSYSNIQKLITAMQNTIRPIDILSIDLSGDQSSISATISAQTYFQPGIKFNINKETVN